MMSGAGDNKSSNDVPVEVKKQLFIAACVGDKETISELIASHGLDSKFLFDIWKVQGPKEPGDKGMAVCCEHGVDLEELHVTWSIQHFLYANQHLTTQELANLLSTGTDNHGSGSGIQKLFQSVECECVQAQNVSDEQIVTAGFHLLHLFASLGRCDMIEWFHAAYPQEDFHFLTPLLHLSPIHLAVANVFAQNPRINYETIALLTKLGVDLNAVKNHGGMSAMSYAVQEYDFKCIELLVELGFKVAGPPGEQALFITAQDGEFHTAKVLLEAGANPNTKGYYHRKRCSALVCAIRNGKEKMVQLLVDAGADVNDYKDDSSDTSPLQHATRLATPEIVEILLNAGADPNYSNGDGSALFNAVARQNFHMVKQLLNRPDIDACVVTDTGYSALHQAAWIGQNRKLEIVTALVEKGVPYDAQTQDKNTPLSLAAHGDQLEVVLYLLKQGCDVNNADKDWDTPLIYASYNNSLEMVNHLIQYGADPHLPNNVGTTPLWNAVFIGNLQMAEFLLEYNVPLDVPSVGIQQDAESSEVIYIYDEPNSPLSVAIDQEHFDMAKLLILAGCSLADYWRDTKETEEMCSDCGESEFFIWMSKRATNADSLKTICRNSLRKTIGKNLHKVATKLEIPQTLVDFLLLKCT